MRYQLLLLLTAFVPVAFADGPADNIPEKVRPVPPPGASIPEETRSELSRGVAALGQQIQELRSVLRGKSNALALIPDIEAYRKAVDWAVTYDEIFNPASEIAAARLLLKEGSERAQQLRDGNPLWPSATGLVVRAYVSQLDGSVQPYGLVVPATFQPHSPHRYRLDVWFHGRDEKLSELNFLAQRRRSPGEFTPPNTIVLHPYSRYCNGQKLAGEVDFLEALADVMKRYPIDEQRVVVRGFSLGGAACWHIAAHYPGRWAAAAPGAGFAETPDFLKVFQREAIKPTWFEQALWHQYDCTDYAINFFNLPTVAYSGEIDSQKQAADIMAKAMEAEGLELTHIIGPQTRHSYHPAAKAEIARRIDSIAAQGRERTPRQVRFTTWTLRYNNVAWLTVDGLGKHWERARIDASIESAARLRVEATNVSAFTISMPAGTSPFDRQREVRIVINGQETAGPKAGSDRSWQASFIRKGTQWERGTFPPHALHKTHQRQGPIDDAFMGSFLVVRPTGAAANEKIQAWTAAELAHFTNEWRRHFRGDAPVKDDSAVTDTDIAAHNLILWGDPSSNVLLRRIANQLPVQWNGEQLLLGGKGFARDHHVPLLIYPNPLNPERYVVLNSGFTFREYDYLNNARQVPKLPDFAIVDVNTPVSSRWPGAIVHAGFFDEQWQVAEEK